MAAGEADALLIEGVRRGDPAAWREVIERYQGRLLSFARRMLAQPGDAEDVVQETFLGLLRSLPGYDRERSLETYLFAILRNKLHDQFRRAGRGQRQSLESLETEDAPRAWVEADTPSRRLAEREQLESQRGALSRALRRFAEQCREQGRFQELILVEMLVVLGLRNKEAAADMGMTETAVAGVKFRVLERLRALTREAADAHAWCEADLSRESSVARVWREEGIACPKRSTLGRYLLGALDDGWNAYVEFHVNVADCDRCSANLDDLRAEDRRDADARERLRERCFASSVGFLSKCSSPEA